MLVFLRLVAKTNGAKSTTSGDSDKLYRFYRKLDKTYQPNIGSFLIFETPADLTCFFKFKLLY